MMSFSIFSRSIWWEGKHSAQMIQFSVDCIICRSPNRNDKSQQNEKRVKILYHPDSTGYLEEDRAIQAIWWLEDQPTDEPCSTRFFRDRRVALQESWSSSDLWDRSGFMPANDDSQKVTVMPSTQLQRRLNLMINGFVVHRGFKGYQKGWQWRGGWLVRGQLMNSLNGVGNKCIDWNARVRSHFEQASMIFFRQPNSQCFFTFLLSHVSNEDNPCKSNPFSQRKRYQLIGNQIKTFGLLGASKRLCILFGNIVFSKYQHNFKDMMRGKNSMLAWKALILKSNDVTYHEKSMI